MNAGLPLGTQPSPARHARQQWWKSLAAKAAPLGCSRSEQRTVGLADLVDEQIDGSVIAAERLAVQPAPDTLLAAWRRVSVQSA
jgi:beta-phosphoglucomutase-like phosphatase (HAD superfamily)